MSSWVAAIIDTGGRSDFWDVARKHHVSPSADAVPVRALIDCVAPDFEASTQLAEALSADLGTPAIGLFMQTAADAYALRVFEGGTLVRRLDYARDGGGWLNVSGKAQPWESVLFFDGPADLAPEAPWPDTLYDELSDEDIARYEAARGAGDASNVMDLVHASSGGILRVVAALGVDPKHAAGRYRRPRWWHRFFGR